LQQDCGSFIAGVADADVLANRQDHIDLVLGQAWLNKHDGGS
jgi:hypothetical protein